MFRIWGLVGVMAINYICSVVATDIADAEVLGTQPKRCTYEYAYEMYGAHCGGLRLSKIPSLKSGIEILDFSDNRLRELDSDTVSDYTSIKFLYLADNQIYLIDDNAFASLTYLETLDLSRNVIIDLPTTIFNLPSLRKLYLGGNPLFRLSSEYLPSKPMKAPLELLDLSDCKVKQLPDWGVMPFLIFYNISHNNLDYLEASHFAVMCRLQKVDLSDSISRIRICELKTTILWLQEKNIYFDLDDYSRLNSNEFTKCPQINSERLEALNETHQRCKNEYVQTPTGTKTSRRTWLTVGGGLAGFLVGFILLLYLVHWQNVIRSKRRAAEKEKTKVHDSDRQVTEILLNNVT